MAWEIDPDVGMQSRLRFGRWAAPAVAIAVAVQVAVLLVPASRAVWAKTFGLLALASLTLAVPFAAVHILAMDGDARLDQQRLSGRSAVRLAAALMTGST